MVFSAGLPKRARVPLSQREIVRDNHLSVGSGVPAGLSCARRHPFFWRFVALCPVHKGISHHQIPFPVIGKAHPFLARPPCRTQVPRGSEWHDVVDVDRPDGEALACVGIESMPADNVAGVSRFYVIKLFAKNVLPGGAPCSLWGRGSGPPIPELIALISQNCGPVINNSCRR